MKMLILGANGRTGRRLLHLALSDGHSVTVLVRDKDAMSDIYHPKLSIFEGDVCDFDTLNSILPGHDLVISTLGPRLPTKKATTIYSRATENIIKAMRHSSVKRLIVTSTALLFNNTGIIERILRIIARYNIKHAKIMEQTIINSNIEWTIVRVGFLKDSSNKNYRQAKGKLPDKGNSISRSALAAFLLDEANQADNIQKIVGVSNNG